MPSRRGSRMRTMECWNPPVQHRPRFAERPKNDKDDGQRNRRKNRVLALWSRDLVARHAAVYNLTETPGLSGGLTSGEAGDESTDAVAGRADRALYEAKRQGRGSLEISAAG